MAGMGGDTDAHSRLRSIVALKEHAADRKGKPGTTAPLPAPRPWAPQSLVQLVHQVRRGRASPQAAVAATSLGAPSASPLHPSAGVGAPEGPVMVSPTCRPSLRTPPAWCAIQCASGGWSDVPRSVRLSCARQRVPLAHGRTSDTKPACEHRHGEEHSLSSTKASVVERLLRAQSAGRLGDQAPTAPPRSRPPCLALPMLPWGGAISAV